MDSQIPTIAHEVIELAKSWGRGFIIIGFRGTEILSSVSPFADGEDRSRLKSPQELSEELSALADRNGVPLCLIAYKIYAPQQARFIARPCRDTLGDPWAKQAYESYLEGWVYSLTKDGIEVEEIKTGNLQ